MSTQALVVASSPSYPRKLLWTASSTINSSPISSDSQLSLMADIVPEERGEDEMEITEHPVEQGSVVSDHAFKLPSRLEVEYSWSLGSPQNTGQDPSFLRTIYNQLLQLQANATFFTVYTGKRIYKNMLIRSLMMMTDRETENSLALRVGFKELLLAVTSTLTISAMAQQALPAQTAPVVPQGPVNLQPGSGFNPSGGGL